MFKLFRQSLVMLLVMTVITGVAYPLLATGLGHLLFPHQADGSLIERDGKPVGSALIGQSFTDPKYFWGRPSATSPQPYNGGSSSGSNLGPTNPALVDAVKQRIAALHAADPGNRRPCRSTWSRRPAVDWIRKSVPPPRNIRSHGSHGCAAWMSPR